MATMIHMGGRGTFDLESSYFSGDLMGDQGKGNVETSSRAVRSHPPVRSGEILVLFPRNAMYRAHTFLLYATLSLA